MQLLPDFPPCHSPSDNACTGGTRALWFIGSWNDYLAPTIFIKNEIWQPVTVMVAKFNEQYAINTHVPRIMAGSVMLLVPVLIIYGIFQRWIIESVMFSSVKE